VPQKSVTVMLPTAPPEPMVEQAIRQRAYELYIKRGMPLGHALDDGGSRACTRPLNVRFQRK
jgi:hypothetical protein